MTWRKIFFAVSAAALLLLGAGGALARLAFYDAPPVAGLPMPLASAGLIICGTSLALANAQSLIASYARIICGLLLTLPVLALLVELAPGMDAVRQGIAATKNAGAAEVSAVSPLAAVGFLLSGLVLVLLDRTRGGWRAMLVQGLLIGTALIGITGLVVNLTIINALALDERLHMGTLTAIGLLLLAASLWVEISQRDWYRRMYLDHDDRRITLLTAVIMLLIALIAGFAAFSLTATVANTTLVNNLQVSLANRLQAFQAELRRAEQTATVTGRRPHLVQLTGQLARGQHNGGDYAELVRIMDNVIAAAGVTAIAIHDGNGRLIVRRGTVPPEPIDFRAGLRGSRYPSTLLWRDGAILEIVAPVVDNAQQVGTATLHIPLAAIDNLIQDTTGLGQSGTMGVCAAFDEQVQCLPNRTTNFQVLRTPRVVNGQPIPMAYALAGNRGVITALDHRRRKVISAFAPVGSYGLGMHVKIEATELYEPVGRQLPYILLSLFGLSVIGVTLLRWRITPLARKLVHEIHERRLAEEELRKLTYAVEQSPNAIVITDVCGKVEYVNPEFTRMSGFPLAEIQGQILDILRPEGNPGRECQRLWDTINNGSVWEGELECTRKDGRRYWAHEIVSPVRDAQGRITHLLAIEQDISLKKQTEQRLNYLAYYDALTGLPNRVLLYDRLRQAMVEASRHQRLAAVMILDLDRFKYVNDTLGHDAGDALLKQVAERLTTSLRPGDIVCRLGGDEFALVLSNIATANDVTNLSQKILRCFAATFQIAGRELFVTPSLGVALYPLDTVDADGLLKNADAAMYHAKESGRNTFRFFTAELQQRATKRLTLETDLRHTIEHGELQLHYQPQIDLSTDRVVTAEALLRWNHPEGGVIPPMDFIPLAEETGLIVPIGEWVLRTACRDARAWQARFPGLRVAVNLSAVQLQHPGLVPSIRNALETTGLEPRYLDVEITETQFMQQFDTISRALADISQLGVTISLDDFGTGYSSLGYLSRFPINVLKIDRTFIRDITSNTNEATIVRAIIVMGHTLGMSIVAEGVELPGQMELLRGQGCDTVQGYYCAKPMPLDRFIEFLAERPHRRCA